jgi:hypothetical protein
MQLRYWAGIRMQVPRSFCGYAPGVLTVTCPFHFKHFCFMSDHKKNRDQTNNSSLSTEAAALNAAAIIRNFIFFYPPEVAKEALWQLLSTSMSGDCADDWDGYERSNMLLFYRLAGELVEALPRLLPPQHNAA